MTKKKKRVFIDVRNNIQAINALHKKAFKDHPFFKGPEWEEFLVKVCELAKRMKVIK